MKQCEVLKVERLWLTTRVAMEYLGVGRDFLDAMRECGELPYYVLGRTVFFNKNDIDAVIAKHKVTKPDAGEDEIHTGRISIG